VNPPVIVRDATAGELVIVLVKVWRQDHRFGWWLLLGASHALRMAGVSSVSPCVLDRPLHQHPPCNVEERQSACLGLGPHDGYHLVDPLWLLALVAAPLVHLLRHSAALARWCWVDAKAFQELGELGAWAVGGWGWRLSDCGVSSGTRSRRSAKQIQNTALAASARCGVALAQRSVIEIHLLSPGLCYCTTNPAMNRKYFALRAMRLIGLSL
jgi:hypothetical protein